MNIYFSCSITGGRDDQQIYQNIVEILLARGHNVLTAHLAHPEVLEMESNALPRDVYERDVAWVSGCDALIAEVSTPSHGVGYEIALACELGKPALCLYRAGKRVSKMITGNTHKTLRVVVYQTQDEALRQVEEFTSSSIAM